MQKAGRQPAFCIRVRRAQQERRTQGRNKRGKAVSLPPEWRCRPFWPDM